MNDKNYIPVFPKSAILQGKDNYQLEFQDSISLRDYFAGQALNGLAVREGYSHSKYLAIDCYKLADAMLEERHKQTFKPQGIPSERLGNEKT